LDSLTVGLLEISDCQTADLSKMSDGLIEIVRICMDTVGMILGLLDCWKCWIVRQLIHQKCQIGSSELLEWSDCWTVDLSEMSDRLIGIVRMLRF